MRVKKILKTVELEKIDFSIQKFRISFGMPPANLRRSIKCYGIINPPILYSLRGEKAYQVVSGFRRLEIARNLGFSMVDCLVIIAEMPVKELYLLNLHDHIGKRELNVAEKALFIDRVINDLPQNYVVAEILPLLGLQCSVSVLNNYLEIAQLEENMLNLLVEGKLDKAAMLELVQLEEPARQKLIDILVSLRCSASIQKEIIANSFEIAARDGKSIIDIMDESGIQEIIDNTKLNNRQKTKEIRECLKKRRYPRMTEYQNKFNSRLNSISLPSGISIKPPPYFEGNQWKAEIIFKNPEHLGKKLLKIKELIESNQMQRLLEPPEGT